VSTHKQEHGSYPRRQSRLRTRTEEVSWLSVTVVLRLTIATSTTTRGYPEEPGTHFVPRIFLSSQDERGVGNAVGVVPDLGAAPTTIK